MAIQKTILHFITLAKHNHQVLLYTAAAKQEKFE